MCALFLCIHSWAWHSLLRLKLCHIAVGANFVCIPMACQLMIRILTAALRNRQRSFFACQVIARYNQVFLEEIRVKCHCWETWMEFTADWFSQDLANWEKHLLPRREEPLTCLEIGCFEGRSAMWLVDNVLRNAASKLVCVDPFANGMVKSQASSANRIGNRQIKLAKRRFLANTKKARQDGKLIHIEAPSALAIRTLKQGFDFIFIDGSHYGSDVLTDAVLCWLVLRDGGIMAFDDYQWEPAGNTALPSISKPKPAIDSWLSLWEGQYRQLPSTASQVWIQRTAPNPYLAI